MPGAAAADPATAADATAGRGAFPLELRTRAAPASPRALRWRLPVAPSAPRSILLIAGCPALVAAAFMIAGAVCVRRWGPGAELRVVQAF